MQHFTKGLLYNLGIYGIICKKVNERRDKINIIAEIKVLNADKCKNNLKFGCLLEAASRGKLCGTAQS